MESWLTVGRAADELGLSRERIRAMIRHGLLDATRAGDLWLVDPASVDRRRQARVSAGRPLTSPHAWAALWLLSNDQQLIERADAWIQPWDRLRLRRRLASADWPNILPLLRNRAHVRRLRTHPSDVARLEQDPRLVRSGTSAARSNGLDITAPGVVEGYVRAQDAEDLSDTYLLASSTEPNVVLHVVDYPWPFLPNMTLAPTILAAVDLAESDDGRSRRAGLDHLAKVPTR